MRHTINWFEIPVINFDRAKKFYTAVLGVHMEKQEIMGYEMGFLSTEQDSVSGAIVKGEGYIPSDRGTLVYLNGGNDLNVYLSRVEKAGGKVVVPKTRINDNIGYFALFMDTEGNKVAFHSRK